MSVSVHMCLDMCVCVLGAHVDAHTWYCFLLKILLLSNPCTKHGPKSTTPRPRVTHPTMEPAGPPRELCVRVQASTHDFVHTGLRCSVLSSSSV